MKIATKFSTANLSKVIRSISEVSGRSIPDVVDYETARILEKCISLTPSAKPSTIEQNQKERLYGDHKTAYIPIRSRKAQSQGPKGKRYVYRNRYPDPLWKEISNQRRAVTLAKIKRKGLSKQSWLRLSQMAGLEVKAPKFVQKLPSNFDQNFSVSRTRKAGSYSVSLRNAQPTINSIGGGYIVRRAIAGRISYFTKNLKLGVLNDLEKVAKAYPGIMKINNPGGTLQ